MRMNKRKVLIFGIIVLAYYIWSTSVIPSDKCATRTPLNYSIIAATVPNYGNDTIYIDSKRRKINSDRAWGYLFNLPITALAWKRLGYQTITVITYDEKEIDSAARRLNLYIQETLERIGVNIVLFNVPSKMKTRVSQVLRLAAGDLDMVCPDDWVITSDADLWPLDPRRYVVSAGKNIKVTNAMCCGTFLRNQKRYKHYPMSTIGMTGKTWTHLFPGSIVDDHHDPYTLDDIKPFLRKLETFANSTDIYQHHHGGGSWYLDQVYVSVVIHDHLNKSGSTEFEVERYMNCPRIKEQNWHKIDTMKCFSDAHTFKSYPWTQKPWEDLMRLAARVFDNHTITFLNNYRDEFQQLYQNIYLSPKVI